MKVIRSVRPGNWNFAIAHEAAIPKTRFRGTAIAAANSVSRMAASASGSTSDST